MSAIGENLQETVERVRILAAKMATTISSSSPGIKRAAQFCETDSDNTKRSRSEDECSKDSKDSSPPRSPVVSSSKTISAGDKDYTNNGNSQRILAYADDNATSDFTVVAKTTTTTTESPATTTKTTTETAKTTPSTIARVNNTTSPLEDERITCAPDSTARSHSQDTTNTTTTTRTTSTSAIATSTTTYTSELVEEANTTTTSVGMDKSVLKQAASQQAGTYQATSPSQIRGTPLHEQTIAHMNHTYFNDSILPQSDLMIPHQYVGLVIGKGGENIRRVQSETGATLYIDSSKMADAEGNKLCSITGSVDSVQRASALVQEIIESAKNGRQSAKRKINEGELEFRMKIPAARTGVIIGRGGDTIRAIRSQTQCTIELDKDATDCGPEEKVFVITGPSERVQQAQELINARLASCLQSRSNGGSSSATQARQQQQQQQLYPPNMSSQSSAALQYGNNLYSAYWQQHMAAQAPQQDPSVAWAAYYAQYYAAQMQSSYSGVLQDKNNPPDGGGQVCEESNRQIDTCDYSSQWAQYYRAHGMIKEAEWIELLPKQQVRDQQN